MAKRKIKLVEKELFEVANKLATAYTGKFDAQTIAKASTYTEQTNSARNVMYGVIINTKFKGIPMTDVYDDKTSQSLVKLTIYKLAHPKAESLDI